MTTDEGRTTLSRGTGAAAAALLAIGATVLTGCTSASPQIATAKSDAPVHASATAETPSLSARQRYVRSKLSYAKCLRAEGIRVPDPKGDGSIQNDPDLLNVGTGKSDYRGELTAAQHATVLRCARLIEYPPEVYKPLSDHELAAQEKTAKCFRKHGVSQYPDPLRDTDPDHVDVARRNNLIGQLANLPAYQNYLNYCFSVAQGRTLGRPKG